MAIRYKIWRLVATSFLPLFFLFLAAAAAEEIANEVCLVCHGTEGFSSPAGRPLFINAKTFSSSVHGSFSCAACHADATAIPHAEELKRVSPEICASCHGDVVTTYQQSIHGQARAQGITEAATCASCHGSPHGLKKVRDPDSPAYHLNLPRTCGACHGDPELAKRHSIPVTNAYQLYMDSVHGRALTKSGLLVAANCSSCHGFHEIKPRDDPASKVHRENIPSTCGTCHAGILGDYFEGAHGRAVRAGRLAAPVCIDCHTAHEITRVETVAWKLEIIRECGTCHGESLRTYRDTFHGQVTTLGFTRVARCSDCHGSHRIFPASDLRSSISPVNLVATCQKCHPKANENFARFSPHANPKDKERNPGLYYAARFMTILLVGVFVFFGLHTSLWLSRSIFEQVRLRWPPKKPEGEGPDHDEEERGDGAPEP